MANYGKKWRGLKTANLSADNFQLSELEPANDEKDLRYKYYRFAIKVYICKKCQTWHEKLKPKHCERCKHTIFVRCDSKAEAKRYGELRLLEKAGKISNIQSQVLFPIVVNGIKIFPFGYYADFVYTDEHGKKIIEDVKPHNKDAISSESKTKMKLVSALYNTQVKIVTRS